MRQNRILCKGNIEHQHHRFKYFECETCELWRSHIVGFQDISTQPRGQGADDWTGQSQISARNIRGRNIYVAKWFGFEFLILRCGRTRQTGQDIDQMAGVEDRSGASRPPSPILSRVVNQRENNGRLGEFQVSSLFPADYLGSVWEVPSVFSESIPILLKSISLTLEYHLLILFSKYWNMQKLFVNSKLYSMLCSTCIPSFLAISCEAPLTLAGQK